LPPPPPPSNHHDNPPPPASQQQQGGPPPPASAAALAALRSSPQRPPPSRAWSINAEVPPCDPGVEKWFADIYAQVSTVNLGGTYNSLLATWASLERGFGYEKMSGKPAAWNTKLANRPAVLEKWVGIGRGVLGGPMGKGVGPDIGDVDLFGKMWWQWWAPVQPEWRVKRVGQAYGFQRDEYPEPTSANWSSMRYPGPNGALSFVATLYWWGRALLERGGNPESWNEAVKDVGWVLRGLLEAET
ncbi:hypothetical protein DFH06DRAFT_945310, partial [Mycena polygramma]